MPRRSARSALLLAGLAILLALPRPARAQSLAAGGAIQGTVTDESGGVLPGVNVTIRNTGTGVVRETKTDAAGFYRAPLLPVGNYEVTGALTGFATTKRPSLTLSIGQVLDADLTLKVAAAQEEVTVTAEAPIVEPNRTHQASTVGSTAVANLPVNGRNFIDFVLTTPGVNRDVRGGDISFAGQRGTLNSLVIDGADNNNTFFGQTLGRTGSGRAPYQFSQDAVQEFQVNRNAYSAEYGRAGGAVINVVTKSGTNDFHGSAFEFYRDKSLNANSYANKILVPPRPRQPFRVHQFGGSLGGPLQKDKAFFFLSYDGQRQKIPNAIVLTLPANLPTDADTQAALAAVRSKANDYEQARDQDVFLAKLDYQLDPRHRLTVRYNHQNFTGQNFENSGATNAEEHSGNSLVRTRTVNGSLSSVFTSSFFNELRVQYARDKEPGLANTNDPEVVLNQGAQRILTFGRNNFSPRETTIKRFQVADTVTWIRGAHSWKIGADVNHDDIFNFFPGFFGGGYTFNSLASFNRGIPSGSGESYQQNFGGIGTSGPETHPNILELAAFLQDEWRASKELSVTLGVRYDLQSFKKPEVRNPDAQLAAAGIDTSFLKTDKNNVGARVGLAWKPNAKTVVRVSGSQAPRYPATLPAPPTGVAGVRPSIFVFDKDYENPEVHQASAGVEYALGTDVSLGASYLFVAGRNLQRSRDFNVGTPAPVTYPIQGGGSLEVLRFPDARPFTSFDRIIRFESTAKSTYNGMTLEVKKRFRTTLQASFAYTLGKVEDTKPDATAVVPGNAGDDSKHASNPGDFEADRAPGDNDVRHRAVFSGYWDLSYWRGSHGVAKALLDGWAFSWIAALQTGQPYSERIANDVNNDGNRFNDIVPGSRNTHRVPTAYNLDMRVLRRIALGPKARLELIGEAFNVLNRTNITFQRDTLYNFASGVLSPQLNLSNPRQNFGADSSTQVNFSDTQRIVQLAAKITF